MRKILYRVLSFDGGGVRGIYQARFLEALQVHHRLDVVGAADVLAGTSTGAIVAAGLASGTSPAKIATMYEELGKQVFPDGPRDPTAPEYLLKAPYYSSKVLRDALERHFGNATLGDCKKRLVVTALSLNEYKLRVFDSSARQDKDTPLVKVLLASSAAPLYFSPAEIDGIYYVDGGLCCNNPAFRAVKLLASKKSADRVGLDKIYVLSISTCTRPVTRTGDGFLRLRRFRWAKTCIDLAMLGSSDTAIDDCGLVGFHCRVAQALGKDIALDDYRRAVKALPPLARERAAEEALRRDIEHWIQGPRHTGGAFDGIWRTTYDWEPEHESETDELQVVQEGSFVRGETTSATRRWPYTLSGRVHGHTLIGEWRGKGGLRGTFVLRKNREDGKIEGHWIGTGENRPYFGRWSWIRANA